MKDRAYAVLELTVQETGICTDGLALIYSEEGRIWREHWGDIDIDWTPFDVLQELLEWVAANLDDYRNDRRMQLPLTQA